jgi:hypothetical protein
LKGCPFLTAFQQFNNRQQTTTTTTTMQSTSSMNGGRPPVGKNAGKNKKKRANKKRRAAAKAGTGSGTMTSQLGAGRATVPQWCKIDIDQVANHAGGFVWKLSDLDHARRYLIMGAKDNGNYYQTSEQVSTECNTAIIRVIRSKNPDDFKQLCTMIEDISVRGLAARQEPTLLSLAAAIVFAPSVEKKVMALALVPKCVRIPTHVFMLAGYVTDLSQCKPGKEKGKGWGSGFRKALSQYYTSRRGLELATALTKYKNREGWRHEDLLRTQGRRRAIGVQVRLCMCQGGEGLHAQAAGRHHRRNNAGAGHAAAGHAHSGCDQSECDRKSECDWKSQGSQGTRKRDQSECDRKNEQHPVWIQIGDSNRLRRRIGES